MNPRTLISHIYLHNFSSRGPVAASTNLPQCNSTVPKHNPSNAQQVLPHNSTTMSYPPSAPGGQPGGYAPYAPYPPGPIVDDKGGQQPAYSPYPPIPQEGGPPMGYPPPGQAPGYPPGPPMGAYPPPTVSRNCMNFALTFFELCFCMVFITLSYPDFIYSLNICWKFCYSFFFPKLITVKQRDHNMPKPSPPNHHRGTLLAN